MKKIILCAFALLLAAACNKEDISLKGNAYSATGEFGTPIYLEFHPSEYRVFGKVVNRYNGPYTIDGNLIKFGLLATTMMMGIGDSMKDEQAYFQFLTKVDRFELNGETLILKAPDGEFMTFTYDGTTEDYGR